MAKAIVFTKDGEKFPAETVDVPWFLQKKVFAESGAERDSVILKNQNYPHPGYVSMPVSV